MVTRVRSASVGFRLRVHHVLGLLVLAIFLIAGWPNVCHRIETFFGWAGTLFQSK